MPVKFSDVMIESRGDPALQRDIIELRFRFPSLFKRKKKKDNRKKSYIKLPKRLRFFRFPMLGLGKYPKYKNKGKKYNNKRKNKR